MLTIVLNLTYGISVIVLLYSMIWLLVMGNKNNVTYTFIISQLLIVLWCSSQLLSYLAHTRGQLFFSYGVGYLGICFIGATWLLFSLYCSEIIVKKAFVIGIYIIPCIHFIALMTNSWHHLFYKFFDLEKIVYGPLFYTDVIYTYLCVAVSLYIIYKSFIRNKEKIAMGWYIFGAVLIPVSLNSLYLTNVIDTNFDTTPLAFSVSSILMLLVTYKYNFLNVNSIAFDRAFVDVSEGVLIYNKVGKITYINKAVERFFAISSKDSIWTFYHWIREYDDRIEEETTSIMYENLIEVDGKTYNIKRYNHFDKKDKIVATTLMFTDMSKYYELLNRTKELAVSNQQLAIEKERNRIAQEVHDTIGHTLTMIQSLTKLTLIECEKKETKNLINYLTQAQQLSSDGIKELRCSINNMKQERGYELVSQGIYQLAESIKSIEVEVCIHGEDGEKYSHLSGIIYESLREAITNAMKYANCTHMDVIIKFHEESIDMYVFDNGEGCEVISSGNGITGIKNRINALGGTVNVMSQKGEGFRIVIKIPVLNRME